MLDPVVSTLIALSFALLFGTAALHKWRDLAGFAAVLDAYRLLPPGLVAPLAWVVPLLESAAARGLLARQASAAAAGLGILLLSGYAGAIGVNLHRGRRDIACGCGGPDQRRPIAGWMLGRNLVLAMMLTGALWPRGAREIGWTDRATIAFGLAGASLIYLCLDRIGFAAQRARTLQAAS